MILARTPDLAAGRQTGLPATSKVPLPGRNLRCRARPRLLQVAQRGVGVREGGDAALRVLGAVGSEGLDEELRGHGRAAVPGRQRAAC